MALLELKEISKTFGGLRALDCVSFQIEKGEIIGLIGPNGAGKTTLFNVISGSYKPSGGKILFKQEDVTQLRIFQIASRGLTRTYQETILFRELSVEKNILIGCHLRPNIGIFEQLFATSSAKIKEKTAQKKTDEILELLELTLYKDELAKNLAHGYQRALGVAIALAAEPELLMMDEPFGGMNAEETRSMMGHIRKIHQEKDLTILLVEHDVKAVMGLSNRVIVLNFGKKIAEGLPVEIQRNRSVIEAYLGVDEDVV